MSQSFRELSTAFRQRKKRHISVRLGSRELADLTAAAAGRPLSVALEDIVAAHIQTMGCPERIEQSVKNASFAMSARLVGELHEIAESSGTTVAAIVREAIRDYPLGSRKGRAHATPSPS